MFFFFLIFIQSFDPSYCETPFPEYVTIKNADLLQVQLITRHGARTPLHISKTLSNRWSCSHTELRSINNETGSPIHVTNSYGKSIFLGNCQFGQLVHNGKIGLVKLGKYMRSVYINKLKFLPNKFNPILMRFRSTNSLRTLHSQMELAKSLYPDIETIQIHTADKQYDPWRRTSSVCPQLKDAIAKLSTSLEYQNLGLDDDNNITAKMVKIFGVNWEHTNDAATSARCEGFPLPLNISHEEIDRAVSLKARQRQFIFSHESVFPLFFSFSAAEMLNEMISRINGESRLRFIHWSAHDGNILAFLGFLGYSDGKWPPYGSYIIVELWKSRNRMRNYFVQFWYNGKKLNVHRFRNTSKVPFIEFKDFVNHHLPDIEKDCKFNVTKFKSEDTFMILN